MKTKTRRGSYMWKEYTQGGECRGTCEVAGSFSKAKRARKMLAQDYVGNPWKPVFGRIQKVK